MKNKFGSHFGPEAGFGPVPKQSINRSVNLRSDEPWRGFGDAEPEKSPFPEQCPPDGYFRGEYLVFELPTERR